MDSDLAAFLGRRIPAATETVDWGDGFRFRAAVYLGGAVPPLAFVTSVRAVVLRGGEVLVQRDRTRRHVLPGGRREPGEAPEATLAREVREETGWSLRDTAPIGVLHYRHRAPRPPGYAYPYPDFLQMVYVGYAATFDPKVRLDDGFEIDTAFLPVAEARGLGLSRLDLVMLDAAVARAE